ncbi:zinc-dependent alcohol dehydrogenase [Gracilibacillus salinarum]|uniref:Zinc-binding alcohol dehydrogenase n=1 Tax=Gracilibacillus salinarum TaxID=2932255 RepID=A0ABY4GRG2_9BACI|nr:zinc-binding alcohol dehydrogenase [Gracilibacillus salinarum]UOQ86981.1 zinc-binding alcohol dehydrogenase [Gracilibacillus salinarum]
MDNREIVFVEPWKVEITSKRIDARMEAHQVLVKKIYTMVSPGTELACLSGMESWFNMPGVPGYASVSEIVEVGSEVTDYKVGDVVFHYGKHSRYEFTTTDGVFLKVPEGLELKRVPFTRMATIALTAIRVSEIELGDLVSVTGQGIVGNMAAQLAALQGAEVIGLDLANERLLTAKECGIKHCVNAGTEEPKDRIMNISNGKGVNTAIDATGVPKVAIDSLSWIGKFGEIILLGTPRGTYNTDVTEVLRSSHLFEKGCINFKGAHEWRYPVAPDTFVKHSLLRNSTIVFQLLMNESLIVDPLISHIIPYEKAPEAYEGLRNNKDLYNGVLFKW